MSDVRPPRENIVRAQSGGFEVRSEDDGSGGMPLLYGYFNRSGEWTEIDSMFEGHFMERFAPGALKKTITENRNGLRILFQHGKDPHIGDKPLASVDVVREDETGGYYEGRMLDTSYNRDLIPGLEAGQYGASFRFSVVREEVVDAPEPSDTNPKGLPERTIKEARLYEFGPVTFPAYAGATAGVRSLTDEIIYGSAVVDNPRRLRDVLAYAKDTETPTPSDPAPAPAPTPPTPAPATSAPVSAVRSAPPAVPKEGTPVPADLDRFNTLDDLNARAVEVQNELERINAEHGAKGFDDETRATFDDLAAEKAAIVARQAEIEERNRVVGAALNVPTPPTTPGTGPTPTRTTRTEVPDNIFDLTWYRQTARNDDHEAQLLRDGARRAVDRATFPQQGISREDAQEHVDRLLTTADDERSRIARHILATGSERYERAFSKYLAGRMRTMEEDAALERALSLTGSAGGFAVPFTLDPTIIPTSNLAVNPFRAISRVEQITGDEWRGISSAGITAAYAAEATETTDNAPTLAQPTVSTEKAQAFVPFSIEVGMDWGSLQSEMARLLQDAKDELEASKFATGTGTNEPQGVITGATTTTTFGGTAAFAIADLDLLEAALPPRFRPRASIVMNRAIAQKVRHFDTQGGAAVWNQGVQLVQGLPNNVPTAGSYGVDILGYPAYESSAMAAVLTTGSKIAILGDFNYYLIVDRIGLTVEVIQHLVGSNHRPTGQRGLYAYWRNGAGVLSASAFRVGVTG